MIRERLSSTVMETLLALTVFREEFSGFFVAMFATLVFIKVLHWLVQDRVDYIEVSPSVSWLHHLRIIAFMTVLVVSTAVQGALILCWCLQQQDNMFAVAKCCLQNGQFELTNLHAGH